ncbi:MAG: NAD(P)H-hydrate dehydratase [Pseudomonadota bacterium]
MQSEPRENTPALWSDALPRPAPDGHKYDRGHVAILGAPELTGATRLAASACSRIGAGLVTVLSHDQADVFRTALPPDIMVRSGPLADLKRITVLLAGPGGFEASRLDELKSLPENAVRVLDADAIGLWKTSAHATVLTPHEGEFARAFPDVTGTRTAMASAAADRTASTIVLKGPDTVIAAPGGDMACNTHASPYLAKAGTGDVLAGIIAGLIAQGMEPFAAACAGVWIHGEAACRVGRGLIAGDLVDELPAILGGLLN